MTKILKWLGILLAIPCVAIGLLVVVAHFHDGPLGPVAGGPFKTGAVFSGDEPDWQELRDQETVEFQLLEPARSRTTWILEHEGRIYIPCGYMDTPVGQLWKQWPLEAQKDGRALLRVGSWVYERQLVRLSADDPVIPALGDELRRKYGRALESSGSPAGAAPVGIRERIANGSLWLFEMAPRS